MKKENNPLPDLLKYFRKKKHLTQEQVAKQLSVSRASYASYETGRIIPGMLMLLICSCPSPYSRMNLTRLPSRFFWISMYFPIISISLRRLLIRF